MIPSIYAAAGRLAALGLRLPPLALQRERLAEYPASLDAALAGRPVTWLHGASVGELRAAEGLSEALRERFPDRALVLSATSLAGRDVARANAAADAGILAPLDSKRVVERALDRLRPRAYVFIETELWPVLLAALAGRGLQPVLLSGRISPRAFRRYQRLRPWLVEWLEPIGMFGMQSEAEAERILALGARPERVCVTGNLKLDRAPQRGKPELGAGPIWVAGSTRPGEEAVLLEAWTRLRKDHPDLRLVLAPRHATRFDEVAAWLRAQGRAFTRRSEIGETWEGGEILLLDSIGELAGLYPQASVAFVGGTLATIGGHSLIEAARAGCPLVFGPHLDNVREQADALIVAGGAEVATDADGLARTLGAWLADTSSRARAGRAAAAAFPRAEVARQSLEMAAPLLGAAAGGSA